MFRIFGALLCIAALASVANAKGFYVHAYGGANWSEDYGASAGKLDVNIDPETGFVIGGSLGTAIDSVPGLRAELDLSYRHNALDGEAFWCEHPWVTFGGTDSNYGLTANAIYEVPFAGVRPYVLAGVGYGQRTISVQGTPIGDYETDEGGFVWQVGTGVNFTVAKGVDVGLGVRYYDAPTVERDIGDLHFEAGGRNVSAILELTTQFD